MTPFCQRRWNSEPICGCFDSMAHQFYPFSCGVVRLRRMMFQTQACRVARAYHWTSHQNAEALSPGVGKTDLTVWRGERTQSVLRTILRGHTNQYRLYRAAQWDHERTTGLVNPQMPLANWQLSAFEWGMYLIGCTYNLCFPTMSSRKTSISALPVPLQWQRV